MDFLSEPTVCLLTAALLLAFSGVPALLIGRPLFGQRLAAIVSVVASLMGEYAVAQLLSGKTGGSYELLWSLPFGPALISIDPLSTLFLLPLFLITACASIYSLAYWPADKQAHAGKLTLFIGIFAAAMVLVVMARHAVLFLMAWEIMALSAYFLLTADQQNQEVRRVSMVYLLATHSGTAALFVLFSLLAGVTGSYTFPGFHAVSTSPLTGIMLVAALIGFGGKAGIMPFHFWLPGAHANAPSHVSAMMSGLMLKMGVYGILRTISFFDVLPPWLGWLILAAGAVSALNGIALAAVQKDLKRLLACSSIENIGIIFIGIGVALVGVQTHSTFLTVCGFFGAFIHIINHALFKSLLFLGSGVLIHATASREIDLMGGLAKKMPITAPLFLIGSLAICGLPPLNGFVGELFLYLAALDDGLTSPLPLVALILPALALVGGMAVITFVKLYGIVFLGAPRSQRAAHGHEASRLMTGSMAVLAVCCLVGGMIPLLLIRLVSPAISFYSNLSMTTVAGTASRIPLTPLMLVNLLLVLVAVVVGLLYARKLKRSPLEQGSTWGCGYLAPTPRMQYTGTSFSELAVSLLGSVVSPIRNRPPLGEEPFPSSLLSFRYFVTETVLDKILYPAFFWTGLGFSYLRKVQHGHLHIYMLYIFATLLVLLVWSH